jgi:hypothetical protein
MSGSILVFVWWELGLNYSMADKKFSDLALLVLEKEVLKRLGLVSIIDKVDPEEQNRRIHLK